jgi:hypothetical protein
VAVLHQGKLQGVGAPAEIVSLDVHGTEILFEERDGHPLTPCLTERATQTGRRYRIEVPEADLYPTLDQMRACEARILSVSPVRPTLEDYFFRLVDKDQAPSHAVEVRTR